MLEYQETDFPRPRMSFVPSSHWQLTSCSGTGRRSDVLAEALVGSERPQVVIAASSDVRPVEVPFSGVTSPNTEPTWGQWHSGWVNCWRSEAFVVGKPRPVWSPSPPLAAAPFHRLQSKTTDQRRGEGRRNDGVPCQPLGAKDFCCYCLARLADAPSCAGLLSLTERRSAMTRRS